MIAAILLERHLHSVANYLIVSLAVADLLVACLVMPLGAVYEVTFTTSLLFVLHSNKPKIFALDTDQSKMDSWS